MNLSFNMISKFGILLLWSTFLIQKKIVFIEMQKREKKVWNMTWFVIEKVYCLNCIAAVKEKIKFWVFWKYLCGVKNVRCVTRINAAYFNNSATLFRCNDFTEWQKRLNRGWNSNHFVLIQRLCVIRQSERTSSLVNEQHCIRNLIYVTMP